MTIGLEGKSNRLEEAYSPSDYSCPRPATSVGPLRANQMMRHVNISSG